MTFQPGAKAEEKDYHGHPNYMVIYIVLIVLLLVSLATVLLNNHTLAVVIIFSAALIKVVLVVANFMHLKFEPKLLWILPIYALIVFMLFYFCVLPDVRAGVPLIIAR